MLKLWRDVADLELSRFAVPHIRVNLWVKHDRYLVKDSLAVIPHHFLK